MLYSGFCFLFCGDQIRLMSLIQGRVGIIQDWKTFSLRESKIKNFLPLLKCECGKLMSFFSLYRESPSV